MVLGTMQMEAPFGMDTACKADKEHSLPSFIGSGAAYQWEITAQENQN